MSKQAKMTPGPWVFNGRHTIHGIAQVERVEDARAIAALPELVEAAQAILDIGKRDMSNPKYDTYFADLRRILARIDNGE